MKRFRSPRGMFFLVLLVAIILIAYYWVSVRGERKEEESVELTAVQNILLRDLERNYPKTPKEVIRYYSEISQCFYGEEYSEEELLALAMQVQKLYDEELIANKDEESYLLDLKSEITAYKESDWEILSYSISASTDVDYFWEDGDECARLYCTYNLRTGSSMKIIEEVFILRKDTQGHWKIFGWDLVEPAKN